jgi:protein-L-isoaspartate(D-aspartate) O-methyltransferase
MVARKPLRTGFAMIDYTEARETMVDGQVRPSDVTRQNIISAMLEMPREKFVPASQRTVAYVDRDIPLGKGRALLAPRTFAKMLDAAEIGPDETVLDVGCGLGYSSAVIARLCRGVIAVEEDEAMVKGAEATLAALAIDNAAILNAPLAEGVAAEGPYDVIVVSGGAIATDPTALYDQLAEDGRLIAIWASRGTGQVRLSVKSGDDVATRWVFDATAPILPGFEAKPSFAF